MKSVGKNSGLAIPVAPLVPVFSEAVAPITEPVTLATESVVPITESVTLLTEAVAPITGSMAEPIKTIEEDLLAETEFQTSLPTQAPKARGSYRSEQEWRMEFDWSLPDNELSKQSGASITRIRQLRKKFFSDNNNASADFSDVTAMQQAVKVQTNYQLMAETTFDSSVMLLSLSLGPEWQPRNLEVNGQSVDERQMMVDSLKRYYQTKNMPDLPPGVVLCFAIASYAAPRVMQDNTKTKLKLGFTWFKVKLSSWFKRKKKLSAPHEDKTN